MTNYETYLAEKLKDPKIKKEYDALAPEFARIRAVLDTREKDSVVYPAIFKLCDDQSYFVRFPDIPNAMTQGFSRNEALCMAEEVLRICVEDAMARGEQLPAPSDMREIQAAEDEFINLVHTEVRNGKP